MYSIPNNKHYSSQLAFGANFRHIIIANLFNICIKYQLNISNEVPEFEPPSTSTTCSVLKGILTCCFLAESLKIPLLCLYGKYEATVSRWLA